MNQLLLASMFAVTVAAWPIAAMAGTCRTICNPAISSQFSLIPIGLAVALFYIFVDRRTDSRDRRRQAAAVAILPVLGAVTGMLLIPEPHTPELVERGSVMLSLLALPFFVLGIARQPPKGRASLVVAALITGFAVFISSWTLAGESEFCAPEPGCTGNVWPGPDVTF